MSMAEPWFKDGLRFKCTQCGDCCTGAPGYVWVNQEEIEALAREVKLDGRRVRKAVRPQGRHSQEPARVRQRRLRVLRRRGPQVHRLRGPAAAVPHVALLGFEREDRKGLEADLRSLPRQRQGADRVGRGDSGPGGRDQALMLGWLGQNAPDLLGTGASPAAQPPATTPSAKPFASGKL